MATPMSKPEPMNAITHHSKVKTSLKFADPLFIAGGAISGKMEMECKADKGLGLGIIMVELFAIEELTSRDHSATQTFLHSRRIFQGPGLPPSNSVHPFPMPDEPPLPVNYYHARRGTSTFLFRFPLPESSPSSINFGSGIAQLRYEVRATVAIIYKGERRLVTDRKLVDVVEMFRLDPGRPEPEGVIVGEGGKILMQGKVLGGVLVAGQPACVELLVKNHSSKKNSGLTVTISRELHLAGTAPNEKPPLQLCDTLTSVSFRGPEFVIHPGVEGLANLVFDVPANARSLKGGVRENDEGQDSNYLFEVRCTVAICLKLGFANKDITLELPVTIQHPATVPQLPYDPYYEDTRPYSPPNGFPLESYIPPFAPMSPQPAMSPPIYGYDIPSTSPPPLPFIDGGRVWLPTISPGPFSAQYAVPPPRVYPPPVLSVEDTQHVHPVRPSSAEPTPSQPLYPVASGLPPPIMHQPLVPMHTGSSPAAERVEGKGERASRITHHLRMSSRTRSVSPMSHRYAPPPVESQPNDALHIQSPHTHHHSPSRGAEATSPMSHTSHNTDVASPRPMPSPKQTYATDPFTKLTFSKSERVEALERIAAATDDANRDMSTSVPDLSPGRDKTLPKPPVPSTKHYPPSPPTATLEDVFSPLTDADPDATPPTPTLAAFVSPKASRAALGHIGGLDALEARLLAEVGTRKVEQDTSRPDVRSVLPISIPRPDVVVDPAIDSAISSLSLPGLGADEGTLRLEKESHSAEPSERGRVRTHDAETAIANNDRPRSKEPEARERKKKSGQKAHSDGIKEKEQHRLRKAAQGRVAAWLGGLDPEVPSPVVSSSEGPSAAVDQTSTMVDAIVVPTSVTPPDPQPPLQVQSTKEAAPSAPQNEPVDLGEKATYPVESIDAKPNPRSSGFMPIRPEEPQASDLTSVNGAPGARKKLVWPQRIADPEVRYDVRSARGGRGGKVTQVAAIWASQQSSTPQPSTPVPKAKPPPPKKLTHWSKAPVSPSPLSQSSSANKDKPSTTAPSSASPGDLSARRAKMVKSSSVPAVVSSSLATPMLSSTASLARPSPKVSPKPATLPPTIEENISDVNTPDMKSLPKKELAFGQARLRELIKKYQG